MLILTIRILLIIFTLMVLIVNLIKEENEKTMFVINAICMLYLIYLLFS